MSERVFQTTSPRGLDRDAFPMRLFQKAKQRGVWDPAAIDFRRDRRDWRELANDERDLLLRLTSLFQAGEESVALDLLPLIQTVAEEGRLEEEIFLAAFLWEEAKHVELFRRFLDEVAEARTDLAGYHTPSYRTIFYQELPRALARLDGDRSPAAQAEAAVTYNLVVEGVLAETGYWTYEQILEENDLMPGMRRAVGLLRADEARHLAFGVYFLSRLLAEHGDEVWTVIERRMSRLLGPAVQVIDEAFAAYDEPPFGLEPAAFAEFAAEQFRRRFDRLERARELSRDEVERESNRNLDQELS